MAKRWTQEEKDLLIKEKGLGMDYPQINIPNRSDSAKKAMYRDLIKNGSAESPRSNYKKWTKDEESELIRLRDLRVSYSEISNILGISEKRLMSKMSKLKLRKERKTWSNEELLDFVRRYVTQDNLNYNRLEGEPSSGPIVKRFGCWSNALELSSIGYNPYGLKPEEPTILYLVDFGNFKKVGITQRKISERFRGFPEYKVLDSILFEDLAVAREVERVILRNVKLYKILGNLPNGNYECFNLNCTELSEIYPKLRTRWSDSERSHV